MKFIFKWLKDKINESDRENYPRDIDRENEVSVF